jgi:hypothetical protein
MTGEGQGLLFIVTLVCALPEQPVARLVIVTVYTPVAAVVTLVIVGFCKVEVNPGPDHDQDNPAPPAELRINVPPAVTGLLLLADADGQPGFVKW